MTYPQPHYAPGKGFFYLYTKYTNGRELYFQTSPDGRSWSAETKLAGMGGHYQVSALSPDAATVATAFMYHPNGNVDRRTNLYYAQSKDWGQTWQTAEGKPLTLPLASPTSDALLIDYQSKGLNVYIHDLQFDQNGRPAILYLTSRGHTPGPQSAPFTWLVTRYTGTAWETHPVTTSDHNYDTGALDIAGDHWIVTGPTAPGPDPFATGGDVQRHESHDAGRTWRLTRTLTKDSPRSHSYVRRVLRAQDPFTHLWADGHAHKLSESHLYFSNSAGTEVLHLPYLIQATPCRPELCRP